MLVRLGDVSVRLDIGIAIFKRGGSVTWDRLVTPCNGSGLAKVPEGFVGC